LATIDKEYDEWLAKWKPATENKMVTFLESLSQAAAMPAGYPGPGPEEHPEDQMTGPEHFWDIYAIGPTQPPNLEPGRLIELGEKATILIFVWLNPHYPRPISACKNITDHGDKIDISIFTSNMQTMEAEEDLTTQICIPTAPGHCWYSMPYTFEPKKAACLYEMNICARICNCSNHALPQYSGFVTWVENLDVEGHHGRRWERRWWEYDRPIRFMVSDPKVPCICEPKK